MATASDGDVKESGLGQRISVLRLLVSGAATAALIFIVCWIGTFVPFSSPTHAYIGLFTPADIGSVEALAEGTIWSLLFGALSGGLFALFYNSTAPLARR